MAKFDIIIPVYNTEKYLKKCLNSVFSQTSKNFRVIAIDDKSTDHSLQILKEYQEVFPKQMIVIENFTNVGVSISRNIGLTLSDGEYVTFLDSDDFLALDLLEKVEWKIRLFDPDIIVANTKFDYHGMNFNFLGMKRDSNNQERLIIPYQYKKHLYLDRPSVTGKFIKRNLITTKFPKHLKWEDYAFIIPYLANVSSIYYLSHVGYYYTINLFGTTVSDIRKFPLRVLDIFTGSDLLTSQVRNPEHFKKELRILRTMNCLQRVRDLYFASNISQEDKILLANYLVNLINIREGNYQELEYYHYQKQKSLFYRLRMKGMEKLLTPKLQEEKEEETVKQKIKNITRKYQ